MSPRMYSYSYSNSEIETIRQWLQDGHSAGTIAKLLTEKRGRQVTRNAIIGIVCRHPSLKETGFARATGYRIKPKPNRHLDIPKHCSPPKVQRVRREIRHLYVVDVSASSRSAYDKAAKHAALHELGNHDCRWPVNDARVGESHRFCGAHAMEGSRYCPHHAARSVARRPA